MCITPSASRVPTIIFEEALLNFAVTSHTAVFLYN
jgi:hypothetical protein